MESYRLVSKKYHCYVCNQELKKMVQVQDLLNNGFLCDQCGQGFIEIIESPEKNIVKELEGQGTSLIGKLQE